MYRNLYEEVRLGSEYLSKFKMSANESENSKFVKVFFSKTLGIFYVGLIFVISSSLYLNKVLEFISEFF